MKKILLSLLLCSISLNAGKFDEWIQELGRNEFLEHYLKTRAELLSTITDLQKALNILGDSEHKKFLEDLLQRERITLKRAERKIHYYTPKQPAAKY